MTVCEESYALMAMEDIEFYLKISPIRSIIHMQPSISDSSIGARVITEPQTEDSQTDTQPSVPSPTQSL